MRDHELKTPGEVKRPIFVMETVLIIIGKGVKD